jgi:hypothetical protein
VAFIITQAGNDPKVVGLVYIAAFAPDQGESVPTLSAHGPQTELGKYFVPGDPFPFLSDARVKTVFASDLSANQQALIYATQTPASQTVFGDTGVAPALKNRTKLVHRGKKR